MIVNKIEVIYHDLEIVVVNKPGGLLSVPGRGPEKVDSVSSRLQQHFTKMIPQPSVHRLDMFTTGVMVFAMNAEAHRHLSKQFEKRLVQKHYEAVVAGEITEDKGEIRLQFRLDPNNRPHQIYDPVNGKLGITLWQKLSVGAVTSRVRFTPITGRTHQLRLHAAHPKPKGLGAPIVGDSLYGSGKDGDKMLLHATSLAFTHPSSLKQLQFDCPADF